MQTIKGPAIFLAQFMDDKPPFNNLKSICEWAKSLGYVGVQIPTWDARCIDLQKAAESKTYADELKGLINECGLEITERSEERRVGKECRYRWAAEHEKKKIV